MIQRGDVFFADLDPSRGREQAGRRPVVVVSNDALNRLDLVVTVVMGTTAQGARRGYRTNVLARAGEGGLPRDTVFLCYHVRSIDRSRLVDPKWNAARKLGRLPPARMAEVDAALRRSLAL